MKRAALFCLLIPAFGFAGCSPAADDAAEPAAAAPAPAPPPAIEPSAERASAPQPSGPAASEAPSEGTSQAPSQATSQATSEVTTQAPAKPEPRTAPPPRPIAEAQKPPTLYDARIVRRYSHDVTAFTQGLFFANGALYESTGQKGESVIRRIDLRDGTASAEVSLPDEVFGEGATVVGDKIVSVTWRAGLGYVHDLATLEREAEFEIAGEGWGLAYDEAGDRLFLSDGSAELRLLDPDSYAETGVLPVTLNGRPLPRLNELEVVEVDGVTEVWANVWQQDFIVRIDADSGVVTGAIDVSGLYPPMNRADPRDDVPNGIAWEPASERLFVTGKRWPEIFEVELTKRNP